MGEMRDGFCDGMRAGLCEGLHDQLHNRLRGGKNLLGYNYRISNKTKIT